jgi:hypothetical protein
MAFDGVVSGNLWNLMLVPEDSRAEKELVPGLWSDRLYAGGTTYYLLLFTYALVEKYHPGLRAKRYRHVHQKTLDAIKGLDERTRNAVRVYEQVQKMVWDEQRISSETWKQMRQATADLIEWKRWIYPLYKFRQRIKHIKRPPSPLLHPDQEILSSSSLYEDAKGLVRVIRYEEMMGKPLPLKQVRKIIEGNSGEDDKPKLMRWIQKLNQLHAEGKRIQPVFHAALIAVLRVAYADYGTAIAHRKTFNHLGLLEFQLAQWGCSLFDSVDAKQRKRSLLQTFQGHCVYSAYDESAVCEIALGEKLSSAKTEERIYRHEGVQDELVWLAMNTSELGVKWFKQTLCGAKAINPVHVNGIDVHGRFALINSRGLRLCRYHWISVGLPLTGDDLAVANMLVHMLKTMIAEKYTPKNLSSELLVIEDFKTLRALDFMFKDPFDREKIVSFLRECGLPDFIERFILSESKL